MRLLVASDQWWPDYAGGSARVAGETALRLAARGHTVDVVVPAAPGASALVEPAPGLRVHRAVTRGRLPETVADALGTRRAARELDGPWDLLLAHQATTAWGLRRAWPDVPLALVFHASARRELAFAREQLPGGAAGAGARATAAVLGPVLAALERGALLDAAGVLVLSAYSESLVLEDAPATAARLHRVSGGVDTTRFAPDHEGARRRLRIPDGEVHLLTVRRLDSRMGLEALLDAFAAIRLPHLRLSIAGSGPLEGALRAQIARLGLGGAVSLLGRITDTELADRYRAADLFVLPTAAYEGFGLVTAEALACGTPVVGTPAGATPELLAPLSPALVAAGTGAADIAEALRRALGELGPGLRRRCRDHAVARWDWDDVTGRWEEALLAIARGAEAGAEPLSTFGATGRDVPTATRG